MIRYALRFRDGSVSVRRCTDDHEIAAFKTPADHDVWRFNFSPDGRYLALVQSAEVGLTVWDVEQSLALFWSLKARFIGQRPSARTAAESSWAARARFLITICEAVSIVQRWPGRADVLAFRPDGAQIASSNNESRPPACRILDGKTGRLIRTIRLRTEADCTSPGALMAPRSRLAAQTPKSTFGMRRRRTRRATLEGHYNVGIQIAYHPAGTILASTDWSEQLRLWDSAVGRHLLNITCDGEPVIIADGRIVVSRPEQLTPFEVNPALEYRTLAHAAADRIYYSRPSVRHDGRLLAVGTNQGAVIWDLAHGTELAFLPIGNAAHLMFDTSGDLITSGPMGVLRWPINLDAGQGRCDIGPPQTLPLGAGTCGIALDRTGKIMARADQRLGVRRDTRRDTPHRPPRRLPERRCQSGRKVAGDRQPRGVSRRPGLAHRRPCQCGGPSGHTRHGGRVQRRWKMVDDEDLSPAGSGKSAPGASQRESATVAVASRPTAG